MDKHCRPLAPWLGLALEGHVLHYLPVLGRGGGGMLSGPALRGNWPYYTALLGGLSSSASLQGASWDHPPNEAPVLDSLFFR